MQDARITPVSILVTGAEGVAPVAEKLLPEYYVRPVHNFTDIFHGYQSRIASLIYTDGSALHDISRITESRNKAVTQILFRKQEKKRLELDLELYRRDEVEAGEYAGQLSVYGREGKPCYRCHSGVQRIVFSNRSAFYCPSCQPRRRNK